MWRIGINKYKEKEFTKITDLYDVEATEYCDQEVQRGLWLENPGESLSPIVLYYWGLLIRFSDKCQDSL